jgi:DNA replication protein DnaC
MTECALCHGVGLVPTEHGSRACDCQDEARARSRLKQAHIPPSFEGATLDNFQSGPHTYKAYMAARRYIDEFLPGQRIDSGRGLLLFGSVGTGKTHLACGILRALVETKAVAGRFIDLRELLDRLRSSYGDDARESQAQILRPILDSELVVLDELGAARPSDWVFETLELVIGGLYNERGAVIVTTNLPNLQAGAVSTSEYQRAARPETLGDRIGARMWSRLQQMCVSQDMTGPDWRARK